MELLKVFEKVNLVVPIEQRDFINFFEDTVAELSSMYDERFVFTDGTLTLPKSIDTEIKIKDKYEKAIVENILFLAGAGDVHQSEFIRQSKNAYLSYWNENAKGRKLVRNRW